AGPGREIPVRRLLRRAPAQLPHPGREGDGRPWPRAERAGAQLLRRGRARPGVRRLAEGPGLPVQRGKLRTEPPYLVRPAKQPSSTSRRKATGAFCSAYFSAIVVGSTVETPRLRASVSEGD